MSGGDLWRRSVSARVGRAAVVDDNAELAP